MEAPAGLVAPGGSPLGLFQRLPEAPAAGWGWGALLLCLQSQQHSVFQSRLSAPCLSFMRTLVTLASWLIQDDPPSRGQLISSLIPSVPLPRKLGVPEEAGKSRSGTPRGGVSSVLDKMRQDRLRVPGRDQVGTGRSCLRGADVQTHVDGWSPRRGCR